MTVLYNVWLDRTKFTYELDDHRVAREWAKIMKPLSVTCLTKGVDPWSGRTADLPKLVNQFNFLIDAINMWLPEPIPEHFDVNDPGTSLNRLHVHFPKQHNQETDPSRFSQLRTYNHLLHQIEKCVDNLSAPQESISIVAAPEIPAGNILLEDDDYLLFSKSSRFGELLLNYPHVGRHPFELATRNDTDCPSEQVVCQKNITESHILRFGSIYITDNKFADFYKNSGITWPYAIDDPRLAVGYIRLGRLVEVDYEPPYLHKTLGKVKEATKITNWQIFDQDQEAEDQDDTN